MEQNQQLEINRKVNAAIVSCQSCAGVAELEEMQRNFHNANDTHDQSFEEGPNRERYEMPVRCNGCYIVDNEYATDE
jgi:hypothetical protein